MKSLVELDRWKRKEAFDFFSSSYSFPYIQLTTCLELRNLVELVKYRGLSFYGVMSYMVLEAINSVEEFHFGIEHEGIFYYSSLGCSFATLDSLHNICFSQKVEMSLFSTFMNNFNKAKHDAESHIKRTERKESDSGMVYISCLPWIDFEGVMQPMNIGNKDSIPRIVWGKYIKKSVDNYIVHINIQVNHSFQDGWHIASFFHYLQERIYKMCDELSI